MALVKVIAFVIFEDIAQFCFHLSLFANNYRQVFNVILNVVSECLNKK